MTLARPLTALTCLLIAAAAWLVALFGTRADIALVGAAVISALCVVLVLLRRPSPAQTAQRARPPHRDESAEFRRDLFELCAALKLGIRFCEDHLHADPDTLLGELERMNGHITAFVNAIARPVRFYRRGRSPRRIGAHHGGTP